MNLDSSVSVPLWLLYEDEIDAWRAAQPASVAHWLREQNFKGEKHRVVLLPDAGGGLAAAVGGLGRRQGELSLWHAAGLAERLPARRFRLVAGVQRRRGHAVVLGLRLRRLSFRPLSCGEERCRDASRRRRTPMCGMSRLRRNRCAWRATGSTRRRRTWVLRSLRPRPSRLAERHQAGYREWVGEELLAANFPAIHAVGRASGARAPAGRAALAAARRRILSAPDFGRQGRLLRQRRPGYQIEFRHGAHEKGHGRRRRGTGARAHAHERGDSCASCACWCRRWKTPSAAMPTGPAMCSPPARA